MMDLPLWPPFVALGFGVIALVYYNWESRRLDRLEREEQERERQVAHPLERSG